LAEYYGSDKVDLFDNEFDLELGLSLARLVNSKYQPIFEKLSDRDRAALAFYFLPHGSKKDVLEVTRPRVIKWYCPFADQRKFPSGHRYCINVYTGCEHKCQYCYAAGYVSEDVNCKNNFRADLIKDLDALDKYGVPAAPVHVSNSTDPLQSLERQHRHTLFVLEKLVERRHRFTTVTLLTKNPSMLMEPQYIDVLYCLNALSSNHPRSQLYDNPGHPPLRIECSLAFFNDQHRQLLDPAAPDVASRMSAIQFLRKENLPVYLRIDPLFPRNPLLNGKSMEDFGLPDVQPMSDMDALIKICHEIGVRGIIYSIAKITRPRIGRLSAVMEKMKRVYEHMAHNQALMFRGGSWRLPDAIAKEIVINPFLNLCHHNKIDAKACMVNLISTP
jgi:DNA repair photolyase